MTHKPNIIVSIVHIEGPLKGEIQEFTDSDIRIGRNIGYHVQFPRDVLIVSRDHARILREGNRFKLINKSENLTFLNGKPVQLAEEVYLKSGDWIMFAQGGPKVSFLTKIDENRRQAAAPVRPVYKEKKRIEPDVVINGRGDVPAAPVVEKSSAPAQQAQAPLVIRYGPMLKRFTSLPITIGNSDKCDFNLKHMAVRDEHIQVYFSQGEYWIRDLTGQQSVLINGRPIDGAEVLKPDDQLILSNQGPKFRFLAGGRLDEVS
ncbi:MAG: FHA domain-containing protein [Desulfobacteraceae bacterium]|nr:FHA domain-containing protein [Desulfobacteraceae bacterium]MBC2754345.1 FHA domain-containing protein [Desulfobacteraceae bacterium]